LRGGIRGRADFRTQRRPADWFPPFDGKARCPYKGEAERVSLKTVTESHISGTVEGEGDSEMQLNVPPDVEALVQKRLASGAFANAEDVIRCALETLDAEENWTDEERRALDEKIDQALKQVAAGQVYGPDEARRKLAAMRETHLAKNPG
jgi:Arc/MetJ-type ribon-helix-helix transcriptional regulator